MKLEVESYDYQKAIEKVDKLLSVITAEGATIQNIPSATEIVDLVIEAII